MTHPSIHARKNPDKIEWSKLPAHPGAARFGIVAGDSGHRIFFSGGSATLHNLKGLDAEGKPVEFSPVTFAFDVHSNRWETITEDTFDVRSDSRGIVSTPIGPMIIGGLVSNTAVTGRAVVLPKR